MTCASLGIGLLTVGLDIVSGIQPIETENVAIEGSLETSYLLEQVRNPWPRS